MTDETNTTDTEAAPVEAPETEAPATEEAPAEAEGAEPEAPAEAAEEAPSEDEKRRRKGGFQRTIERLRQENEELLRRLALSTPTTGTAPAEATEVAPEDKAAAYIETLVAKKLAEKEAAAKQAAAQAEFQRRTQEVRAAHPDFDEAISDVSDIVVPQALQQALLTSEHGPALMYQLASNRNELARICALPPLEVAREIGRLEARASAGAAPTTKATPKPAPRKPAAPAPIAPVAARGPTTVKPVADMTYEEYCRWRSGK